MLLADVSEQYGTNIPPSRFSKDVIKGGGGQRKEMSKDGVTVDTSIAKHGALPMFLTSEFC